MDMMHEKQLSEVHAKSVKVNAVNASDAFTVLGKSIQEFYFFKLFC